MKTGLLFCLALSAAVLFRSAAAQEVVSLPKDTPYADDETGTVFSARIGNFTKTSVTKHLNPYYGTVIRYANPYGASADIYIYALNLNPAKLSAEQWNRHYEEVKANIAHLTGKSVPIGEIAILEEFLLKIPESAVKSLALKSSVAGKRCTFAFSIGEDPFFSELVIFPVGSKIVKLRVTCSREITAEKENALLFLNTVCRKFFEKAEFVSAAPKAGPS